MWPAEAFNLAHESKNFVYLPYFFHENILYIGKTYNIEHNEKIFWPAM